MLWLLLSALAAEPTPVLDAMAVELDRTVEAWADAEDAPYFLGYRVSEEETATVSGAYGVLDAVDHSRNRFLDVSARVGDHRRDSTHELRGEYDWVRSIGSMAQVPIDDDPVAIRHALWLASQEAIGRARQRILKLKGDQQVLVEETDPSNDFSEQAPSTWVGAVTPLRLDRTAAEALVVTLSEEMHQRPWTDSSSASLHVQQATKWLVTTEGTRIREQRHWARVSVSASATADDGMEVELYRWQDLRDPTDLPHPDELRAWAAALADDLKPIVEAPRGEPYSGPVLLKGRAAGVFIHEVMGHRLEGHRQKSEDEGQTFKNFIGRRVLPEAISIYDDPTLASYAGFDLNGHYRFDEEGTPAQRADLVTNGRLTGFLMSRSPIEGFPSSNGHARASRYNSPVARMANTILETSDPVPFPKLKARMLKEVRGQGLEFGVIVEELDGGFTMTGRTFPNSFNILAGASWKVYADGRPDERIRGIDLIGTPLAALTQVMAAGDDPEPFNGFCGAESGSVPNAAVSPSLLLSGLEMQLKDKEQARPPILVRPDREGGDS